jgi:hypothetical protein
MKARLAWAVITFVLILGGISVVKQRENRGQAQVGVSSTSPGTQPAQPSGPSGLTPFEPGYYVAQQGRLVPLQALRNKESTSSEDRVFLDPVELTVSAFPRFVVYDRSLPFPVPPTMTVNILAKISGSEGWYERNLGYQLTVTPREDYRDMVELHADFALPPGRYTIRSMDGIDYSFAVAGSGRIAEHCVTRKRGLGDVVTFVQCSDAAQ